MQQWAHPSKGHQLFGTICESVSKLKIKLNLMDFELEFRFQLLDRIFVSVLRIILYEFSTLDVLLFRE